MHEQLGKQNKQTHTHAHTKTKTKKDNVYHLYNNYSVGAIMPIVMPWEEIYMYT
jgi:hypothetical protein